MFHIKSIELPIAGQAAEQAPVPGEHVEYEWQDWLHFASGYIHQQDKQSRLKHQVQGNDSVVFHCHWLASPMGQGLQLEEEQSAQVHARAKVPQLEVAGQQAGESSHPVI